MQKRPAQITAACLFLAFSALPAFAQFADSAERENRWRALEKTLFDGKTAAPADGLVTLEAPARAEDAALVPLTVTLKDPEKIKELYVVVDENPSPVAAHFIFGPAADPHVVKMRVRINTYTDVHAIAVLRDGALVEDTKYVKASGGCSAPMGASDEEARKGMGEMRFKIAGAATLGVPAEATLMLRHPNFNGMQMDEKTRGYTPARFIDRISVKAGDQLVFDLSTGISLATDPVLSFGLIPQKDGHVTVEAHDSDNTVWRRDFVITGATN